jgi:2-dehydro-3-deoxygluconokinase
MYDVVTLGETMLRLTPPNLQRLEQTTTLEVQVGGSESNVAVGLARLGLRVAWLSRLTDNALGHLITNSLRSHGVDVSLVVWTAEDRNGLYFLEEGKPPRSSQVIYDRAHSAMSRMKPDDLPVDLFQAHRAKMLHLSGITLALSKEANQTVLKAAQAAKAAGWLISFDVNYRARLWQAEVAASECDTLACIADILFMPLRDACLLYGMPNDPEAALSHLHQRYPQSIITLTLGTDGAVSLSTDGRLDRQPAYVAEAVGRVGGGDAFVAGFLFGYLRGYSIRQALQWGTAAAAYKYSIPGDMPIFTRREITELIESGYHDSLRR